MVRRCKIDVHGDHCKPPAPSIKQRQPLVASPLAEAAGRLADLIGTDLGRIDAELARRAAYVTPRRSIRVQDTDDLVGAFRQETVFKIIEAIVPQDMEVALALCEQVQATDTKTELHSVSGLTVAFRSLAEVECYLERGLCCESVSCRAGCVENPVLV